MPVGEELVGEGDGFRDALGFAAHGWGKVDAGGVFYEDVQAGGAGDCNAVTFGSTEARCAVSSCAVA